MLLIKTYVAQSKIAGSGLFASQSVSLGTIVWQFNPKIDFVFSLEEWAGIEKTLPTFQRDRFRQLGATHQGRFILCVDGTQYINHSDDQFNLQGDKAYATEYRACRNIHKDEELLLNYFDHFSAEDIGCLRNG